LASRLGAAPSELTFGESAARLVPGLFKLRIWSEECRMVSKGDRLFMKHQNLQTRTKDFAFQVIQFCEHLPHDDTSKTLGRQLLRAACSVGANYRAARRAKSKTDFISKLGTVLEEADEAAYWLELLQDAGKAQAQSCEPLLSEANELVAISISSINTARRNLETAQ
jgi:four helix bundle protein